MINCRMKIIMINATDYDGSGKASYRLFNQLNHSGISIDMIVRNKLSNESNVILFNTMSLICKV